MISLPESHLTHKPSAMMTLLPLDSSLRLNQATVTYLLAWMGDAGSGSRSGALSSAMNLPTSSTRVGEPARDSTRRTIAEPTGAPAAARPTLATLSGVPVPKPTHTRIGRFP